MPNLPPNPLLEKCLALAQQAEQAKSQFLPRGQNDHVFLPEGIQIEDLTQAS